MFKRILQRIVQSSPGLSLLSAMALLALAGWRPSQASHPAATLSGPDGVLLPSVSTTRTDFSINYSGCGGEFAPLVNALYEHRVAELTNAERAAQGVPPLKLTPDLIDSARYHATDLGQDNYFEHDTHDRQNGALVWVCLWSDRLKSYYANWSRLAENIAAGYITPENVIAGWMSSAGHRANILNADNWELGVGYYTGSGYYSRYWVQNFGRRRDEYPVIINSEAYSTTNTAVQLYVYAPGDALQMRFSNDGATWSLWQSYATAAAWTLAGGESGVRTVHAQVDTGAQIYQASDDINYVSTAPPDPILHVEPTHLIFLAEHGSTACLPATAALYISNTGGGTLDWDAVEDSAWLDITPGTSTITATCDAGALSALSPGAYSAAITVSAPGATGSPQIVGVDLRVSFTIHPHFLPLVAPNR
jgi:uncharacterized protein YkwD